MVENTNVGDLPAIQGVNADFWTKFGDPSDASTYLHSSKIMIVRHAQSEENAHGETRTHEMGDLSQYTDELIYQRLQDCHISEFGVQQAKECQPLMNHFNLLENKVYCSP